MIKQDETKAPRKPSFSDKVKGEYKEILGKATQNPTLAAEGEALKHGRTINTYTVSQPDGSVSYASGTMVHPERSPPEGMAGGPREEKLQALRPGPGMDGDGFDGLGHDGRTCMRG